MISTNLLRIKEAPASARDMPYPVRKLTFIGSPINPPPGITLVIASQRRRISISCHSVGRFSPQTIHQLAVSKV